MGRKLRAEQYGVFPVAPDERFAERDRIVKRALAKRAGLPTPERRENENLGNRELPVYKKKKEIQSAIRDHQISMIEGPTGSGKSTQIAQYALEMGYEKIIYLEPRVLLADNLSDRIESELSEQLGVEASESLIGVRHSERSTSKGKQIEVMTPGTFMRVMGELELYEDEPLLIVGDEIHEKDFDTEMAIAASVQQLQDRPKWRIALASATLDSEAIHQAYSEINGRPIPRVVVEGRPHELTEIPEPELTPDEAYAKYGSDHKKALIFTAGKMEIRETIDKLKSSGHENTRYNPLHAKLSRKDIQQATHGILHKDEKQAIVSTSAGQSGITIPELTLVITDGTTRRPELNEDGVPGLFKQECTQDELTQQGGRAGRDVGGGTVIYAKPDDPVFSYTSFENREKQAPAQIYHTNISRNVLLASSFGANFHDINEYLIHKVDTRTILEAYDVLYRLQALDDLNNITKDGEAMNRFPVRPEFSRALVEGLKSNASSRVMKHLTGIVSAVEAGGMPFFQKDEGTRWREDVRPETEDDFIAQLDMFYATRQFFNGKDIDEAALAERNYDMKNSYRAHKTFDKIARTLGIDTHDIDTNPPTSDEIQEIHDYLASGLFDFAHTRIGDGRDEQYVSIHDSHHSHPRDLSDRGTYAGGHNLVMGFPRRFEKKEKGELVEHSTIEFVAPLSRQKLAKHAIHLANRKQVAHSKIVNGRLQRTDELHLGTLFMQEVPSEKLLTHTETTRQLLKESAFSKPTQALHELTSIKKHLEHLARLIPKADHDTYLPHGVLNDTWLQTIVDRSIDDSVEDIYTLDNKLRTAIVRGDISARTWISEQHENEILERSPDFIDIGDTIEYKLYYSHGNPIINGFNLRDIDALPDDNLHLPDGREILINHRIDNNTKEYSAGELKAIVVRSRKNDAHENYDESSE